MEQSVDIRLLENRVRDLESKLTHLEKDNEKLRGLALEDEVTALGNRRSFSSRLESALEHAARYGGPVSVMLADVDGFKQVNDQQGHPAGDEVLRRVADVFKGTTRSADNAARIGGDEFGVVMPSTDTRAALRVAERIRTRIEALLLPNSASVTVSFGIATLDQPYSRSYAADEIFSKADAALYTAKRQGKNQVMVHSPTLDATA